MINKTIFKVPEIQKGFGLSILLTILLWYYLDQMGKFGIIYNNYWNYVSLSATLLGFLITAFAIFFAFPTNHKMKLLSKNANYSLLFDAFLLAIYLLFALLVSSLIGALTGLSITNYIYFIFIMMLIWSIVSVGITVWILERIVDVYLSNKEN